MLPIPDLAAEAFGANIPPEVLERLARLPLQRLARKADLDAITFRDSLATVAIEADVIRHIRFKNAKRTDEARVGRLMRLIAARGYISTTPVICRIGRKGKWVVIDGGHRLTALRRLQRSPRSRLAAWFRRRGRQSPWLARLGRRLFGPGDLVHAILFLGPRSRPPAAAEAGSRDGKSPSGPS